MQLCENCILSENYPGIRFNSRGVCNFCEAYENERQGSRPGNFSSEAEIIEALERYRGIKRADGKYDALVALSGGVDSSFALIRLVENYKLRPLAFHNDHGYENKVACENVRKLCEVLAVDLVIWQHDQAFMKKLWKYFNRAKVKHLSACHVCGNILYFNALEMARRFDIPLVLNGYSKGQAEMLQNRARARELYVRMVDVLLASGDEAFTDAFNRKWELLDRQVIFRDRRDLEIPAGKDKILVVPFFVFDFYKTDKEALKRECLRRFDWRAPDITYPDRTLNCHMIWLNTWLDLKKNGYSLYHDEYAALVRAGELTRQQALQDLAFNPPEGLIERLAREIGLDIEGIGAAGDLEAGEGRPAAKNLYRHDGEWGF
jgi:hypothetical protein